MDGILIDSSATAAAETWLDDFGAAPASGEVARIAALFAAECHWRDIIAFTWDLRTTSRADAIATRMAAARAGMAPLPADNPMLSRPGISSTIPLSTRTT